jgi:hypothetical protein
MNIVNTVATTEARQEPVIFRNPVAHENGKMLYEVFLRIGGIGQAKFGGHHLKSLLSGIA